MGTRGGGGLGGRGTRGGGGLEQRDSIKYEL